MKKPATQPRSRSALTAHYIASSHWDREWYEPFQHYRFRLVDVLDSVIDLMERDPEYRYFQTDGQTVLLEDYLEIRPEKRERLKALVQAGRLEIGPWYVLADEFLVSGESLVRNLLRGHQVAAEFGPPLKVGFVCDIFGHSSQLPQIFRGFGIDTAVVWRGTNPSTHPGLFRWQATDGSEVLAYTFEDRGYGHYQFDVRNPARTPEGRLDLGKAVAGLRKMLAFEGARVPGSHILLCDGMDHIPPEPATSSLLARARKAGLPISHSHLPEFFAAVRRQRLKLKLARGELRQPGERGNYVIPGVLSSRIYLKQENARCENLLLQWAEPFGVLAGLLGQEYPAGYLKLAWKYLLRNHPHDSICGCSIDQVHQDMRYRFDQCRLIAEWAGRLSLRAIADRTPLPRLKGEEDFAVTVFNPCGAPIDGVVDLPLYFLSDTANRFQEWFGYEPIVGFRLYDADGGEVPYQRLDVTKLVPFKTYDRLAGYADSKREQVRVAVRLRIPARGWTTLKCAPTTDKTRSTGTQVGDDHTMENQHLRVQINSNGTIDLIDRAAERTYRNCLTFEERADIGDGWYHGTAVNDELFTSAGSSADIALVHDGFALTTFRVRVVMNVPDRFLLDKQVMRRSGDLVPLTITSWLTLRAGCPYLEVRTEVENTVRDHRLRVLIPTYLAVKTYFADSPFDVVERPIALRPDSHLLNEPELESKPQYSFTAVNDGRFGLAVIATGQPESAVRDLPDRPIALTLFRGFARTVGMEGESGGQMLGRTSHTYWIYPHSGPLPVTELLLLGQRLAGGIECVYTEPPRQKLLRKRPALPAAGTWLSLGPGPLVVTACKQSEDGAAVILRAFNPTQKAAKQRFEFLTPIKAAYLADLLEEPQHSLSHRGPAVMVSAEPKQIVTLRVELQALK
jgi:alpha-mannosidase/mannosylglycerate hydrolase